MHRWINNLKYIHELSLRFFQNYDIIEIEELELGQWTGLPEFFNKVEQNIDTINRNTVNFDIEVKTWFANEDIPYVTDYIRIETFMLEVKEILDTLQPSRRLLEDGSLRLLEDDGVRLLEPGREAS